MSNCFQSLRLSAFAISSLSIALSSLNLSADATTSNKPSAASASIQNPAKGPFEAYDVTWNIWSGMATFFPADKVNTKVEEITVEKWISEEPNTEGKFILLEFWGTYCAPCIREIPKLNALHAKYNDRIAIIALSSESAEKVSKFKGFKAKDGKIHPIEYYNAVDSKSTLSKLAGVKAQPTTVIIDPNGKIAYLGPPALIKAEKIEAMLFQFYIDNKPKS